MTFGRVAVAPPAPPPIGGAFALRKVDPRSVNAPPLRSVFWYVVPGTHGDNPSCVWHAVKSKGADEYSFSETQLVSMFKQPQQNKTDGSENVANARGNIVDGQQLKPSDLKKASVRVLKVLDDRKSQNLAIAFRHMPSPQVVMEAVSAVDTAVMKGEQIVRLCAEVPSEALVESMRKKEDECPPDAEIFWDLPEQYLLALAVVPDSREILTIWSFSHSTSDLLGDLPAHLENLRSGMDCLLNSVALRRVLGLMLAVGNRCNANTPRGDASGFSLESLYLFDEMKSAKSGLLSTSISLLEFCVKQVGFADVFKTMVSDLRTVAMMPRVAKLADVAAEVTIISSKIEKCKACLPNVLAQGSRDKLKTMLDKSVTEIEESLLSKLKDTTELWEKTMTYFAIRKDSANLKDPVDLFGSLGNFCRQIERYTKSTTG